MFRLRIKYKKTGRLRLVSHLEMVRLMERIFRRMELPLSFTQGFSPHPKISFASPLSVGIESVAELLDVELEEALTEKEILTRAQLALPEGLVFESATYTEDNRSLMSLVSWADYRVELEDHKSQETVLKAISTLLARKELLVEKKGGKKKGQMVDIRPQIRQLNLLADSEPFKLVMTLRCGNEGSLKPEVVVEALAQENAEDQWQIQRTIRTNLYLEEAGKLSPLSELK